MHRLVLANGCFDLLHVGHLRHLQEARSMGTLLVVGVTRDEGVGKGIGRPVIKDSDRLELIRGLQCVYEAELCANSIEALEYWKPQVFVKGSEYEGKLLQEEVEYCKSNGIEIRFTKPSTISTTKIIERIKWTSS